MEMGWIYTVFLVGFQRSFFVYFFLAVFFINGLQGRFRMGQARIEQSFCFVVLERGIGRKFGSLEHRRKLGTMEFLRIDNCHYHQLFGGPESGAPVENGRAPPSVIHHDPCIPARVLPTAGDVITTR
jgi:hypothetical protein